MRRDVPAIPPARHVQHDVVLLEVRAVDFVPILVREEDVAVVKYAFGDYQVMRLVALRRGGSLVSRYKEHDRHVDAKADHEYHGRDAAPSRQAHPRRAETRYHVTGGLAPGPGRFLFGGVLPVHARRYFFVHTSTRSNARVGASLPVHINAL